MQLELLFPPGRAAAVQRLAQSAISRYGRSRNFLSGAVTRLSPYLRHGILGLAEVRDAAVSRVSRPAVDTFVRELAWRDYYLRVRRLLGARLWDDFEAYKTGNSATRYASSLPQDLARGETGAVCIDAFVEELETTGYLHNHARMWFASYTVHHRLVAWQAGARYFLERLMDGDVAANNLSWQWVASTFSHKPYIFNRDNLERYTASAYCSRCPLASGGCPFAGEYGPLAQRLFPGGERAVDEVESPSFKAPPDTDPGTPSIFEMPSIPASAVVWVHDEALLSAQTFREHVPPKRAIFVWDQAPREEDPWSERRRHFIAGTLAETGIGRVVAGAGASAIAAFARELEADTIVAIDPVAPALQAVADQLRAEFRVVLVAPKPFAIIEKPYNLRRFAQYFKHAEKTAFG